MDRRSFLKLMGKAAGAAAAPSKATMAAADSGFNQLINFRNRANFSNDDLDDAFWQYVDGWDYRNDRAANTKIPLSVVGGWLQKTIKQQMTLPDAEGVFDLIFNADQNPTLLRYTQEALSGIASQNGMGFIINKLVGLGRMEQPAQVAQQLSHFYTSGDDISKAVSDYYNRTWSGCSDELDSLSYVFPPLKNFMAKYGFTPYLPGDANSKTKNLLDFLEKSDSLPPENIRELKKIQDWVEKHSREKTKARQSTPGREYGHEKKNQFDPQPSRPTQELGPFESRLKNQLSTISEAGMSRRRFLKLMGQAAGAAVGTPISKASDMVGSLAKLAATGLTQVLPKLSKEMMYNLSERLFMDIAGKTASPNNFYPIYNFNDMIPIKRDNYDSDSAKILRQVLPKASDPDHLMAIENYNRKMAKEKVEWLEKYKKDPHAQEVADNIFADVVEAFEVTPSFAKQLIGQMDLQTFVGWFFVGEGTGTATKGWLGDIFTKAIQGRVEEHGIKTFLEYVAAEDSSWAAPGLGEALELIPQAKRFFSQFGINSKADITSLDEKQYNDLIKSTDLIDDARYKRMQDYLKEREEALTHIKARTKDDRLKRQRDKHPGREFGHEKKNQFDPQPSRPTQELGPFESRLKSQLNTISEADMSRRRFLKLMGQAAGAAAGAPLEKLSKLNPSKIFNKRHVKIDFFPDISRQNLSGDIDMMSKAFTFFKDLVGGGAVRQHYDYGQYNYIKKGFVNLEELSKNWKLGAAHEQWGGGNNNEGVAWIKTPFGTLQVTDIDKWNDTWDTAESYEHDVWEKVVIDPVKDWWNTTGTGGEPLGYFDKNGVKKLEEHGIDDVQKIIDDNIKYHQDNEAYREKDRLRYLKSKSPGREFGHEKRGQFDTESPRPTQELGPFESRLKSQLKTLSEADADRRALERQATTGGDITAEARLLLDRIRNGELDEKRVGTAGALGHPASKMLNLGHAPTVSGTKRDKGDQWEADLTYAGLNADELFSIVSDIAWKILPIFEKANPGDRFLRRSLEEAGQNPAGIMSSRPYDRYTHEPTNPSGHAAVAIGWFISFANRNIGPRQAWLVINRALKAGISSDWIANRIIQTLLK